jgi:mono/diheme cytochrome c family protein
MKIKNTIKSLAAISLIAFFGSCDRDRNHPGWEYFDDMAHSGAYETYTANPNFADGKTMRNPVDGTIPRDFEPYIYEKNDTDRILAGQALKNPVEANSKNLTRGKEVYQIYCISCHGEKGDGKGHLFTSGKYPFPPKSLLSDKVKKGPIGEIYHVITVGFGVMPAHGAQIRPEDRWKAALYVKNILQKQ